MWIGGRRSNSLALGRAVGALLAVLVWLGEGAAQSVLPDIDVMLVVEVSDAQSWQAFHAEVLGTPPNAAKLDVVIAAGKGGTRGVRVGRPKFNVSLVKGLPVVKVVITGKLAAAEALGTLGVFEQAVLEHNSGSGEAPVGLHYGLVSVDADLLEMYVSRP